jgi:hypothetical protein
MQTCTNIGSALGLKVDENKHSTDGESSRLGSAEHSPTGRKLCFDVVSVLIPNDPCLRVPFGATRHGRDLPQWAGG